MRSFILAVALTLDMPVFQWTASAAEVRPDAPPPASSPAFPPSTNHDDNAFCDPFASETNQVQAKPNVSDPLEGMNRAFFRFNDKFYYWVLKPTAKGYSKVVPQPARVSLSCFFTNLKFPVRLVNNILQGKLVHAGTETGRFVINSTVGMAGFFDPAAQWKIPAHPAEFDQTLGFYGVGPGSYLDWPLLGPSSARGTAGQVADGALSPWSYVAGLGVVMGLPTCEILNGASLRQGEYESFKKATFDPYVAMRSAYFENRASAVQASKSKE